VDAIITDPPYCSGAVLEAREDSAAEAMRETGKPCYVYYLGDFDPSGWQMARNLEEKAIEQHINHGHLEALRREVRCRA
jgi:hypothetical protein